MNIEERIKNDLHNFLVKVEEGRKEHSPAVNVEAYLIDMFAKQMAIDVLLEISLHDKELIEKVERMKYNQAYIQTCKESGDEGAMRYVVAYNEALSGVISLLKQDK